MNRTHARKTETFGGRVTYGIPTILGLALVAAAPSTAFGQALIQGSRAITFTSIANPTIIAPTGTDDGQASVTTPFPIAFYGNTYTDMTVGYNGAIVFPGGQSVSLGNVAPGTGTPNNFIAPYWDDLRIYDATGWIGSEVIGTAPNREFVIEWHNISRYSYTTSLFSMQVRFREGPATDLEVHYSANTGTAVFSATAAMEDSAGGNIFYFAPSGCTSTCTQTDLTGLANTAITVGPAVDPELTGAFTSFDAGSLPGGIATATITLTNLGLNTANGVVTDIWLSADANLDATDSRVSSSTTTVANGDNTQLVTLNIPAAAMAGNRFLIMDIDATDLFPEVDETDNTVAVPFVVGYDFSAPSVQVLNVGGINPGQAVNVMVDLVQGGAPYTGPLEVAVYASLDASFDMMDAVVLQTSVNTNGSPTQSFTLAGTLPALAPGQYYIIARFDPNNAIVESNETNNLNTGNTFDSGPDFAITSIAIPAGVQPGANVTVTTVIANLSVPFTGAVPYTLYASTDNVLDPMTDRPLGTYQASMAGQASLPVMQAVPFAASIPSGYYYILGVVDSAAAIPEANENNNGRASMTTIANAVDFATAQATSSPTQVEVGDPINVTAAVSSLGLGFIGNVPFQVHLSPDPIFDPGDVAVYRGFVFFPGGNSTGDIDVTFPLAALAGQQPLTPGSFTVFVVVDPDGTHAEADETNNAGPASMITIQGADILISSMTGSPNAFIGLPYTINLEMENVGVADARNFQYAVYMSDNDIIRVTDTRVFVSQTATITSGSNVQFSQTIDLPVVTSTRTVWLGAIADIFSVVPETSETNNTRRIPNPIRLVFPIPDMQGEIVETATAGAAGEDFSVTRIVENVGVAPAASFEIVYYLSSNPTIATDDIELGRVSLSLATGEDDYGVDTMTIPSTVQEGTYYVGFLIDPDNVVDEIDDENNNSALGPQIPVYRSALQFLTDRLPAGTVGVEYESGVYATGGPLPITWAVSSGQLPAGLSIDAQSGIVTGTPTTEGVFDFTLRALSGTAFADRAFSVRVTSPTVELTVATPSLPSGIAGRPYQAQLIAVGGTVPYKWTAISMLPLGLTLSESGVISGTPTTPGNFPLNVAVRDDIGDSANKSLALNITNANQTIQITQIPLPTAEVDVEFCDPEAVRFEATNGIPPYSWSITGAAPAGMRLSQTGELCGVPTQVGAFGITVRVQDSTGLFDTSLFVLEVSDGDDLAISTFTLEPGEVGKPYTSDLTAIRGTEPYTWTVVTEWGPIAPGMMLGEDGFLSGTPTADGTFAFVVFVTDAAGRTDVQPLTMVVSPAPEAPVDESGCSCESTEAKTDSPWASALVLLGLGGLIGLRRKKTLMTMMAFAFVAMMATSAQAQFVPGTPYQLTRSPQTYVPLPNPTVLATDVDDGQFPVTSPFPIKYYEGTVNSLSVGANGAIGFPSGTSISLGNTAPGTTSSPAGFVAPMWDDLRLYAAANALIGWQVEGTAPSRTLTVEWRNISFFSYSGIVMSMQVRFYEGASGRIDIDYGTITGSGSPSATMGMEDPANARPILFAAASCTTNCAVANFPINTRVTVIQDPGIELLAGGVTAPELAFLGAQTSVNATVQNLHGNPIGPFMIEIVAAQTQDLMNATPIGTMQMSLPPFTTQMVTVTTVPPQSLGEGTVYLGLNVDSANQIAEVNETNNTVASVTTMRLVRGLADVAVQRVRSSSRNIDAGDSIDVFTRLQNIGGEPATNVEVAIMLSTNPVISRQDVQLDSFTVSLAPGETLNATTAITIDAATNSGSYYIGAYADLSDTVEELSESNNGRADDNLTIITGGALAVATQRLPRAYIGVTYVALLSAAGGDPTDRQWEITSGQLPTGLGLVPTTGELFGRPTMAETQNITVTVTSGSETATRQLTVTVVDPSEPLTIVTRQLAAAVVGQEYAFPLVVTGGTDTSSLSWSGTDLPDGFVITEDGLLAGTPMIAGSSTITVTVTAGSQTASRNLVFEVRDNANLLIVPNQLSSATFNQAYTAQLESTGGNAPITWLIELGRLPAGVTLSTSGMISGTPTQVGTFRFVVEARDSSPGALSAKDINTFELTVKDSDGFAITTESLPNGVVAQGYEAVIEANGGLAPYSWTISEGRLPDGLIADVDEATSAYEIVGQPSEEGISSLLIEVTDSQGRHAVRALSITVTDAVVIVDPGPVDEGCSCEAAESERTGSGIFALLLLAGLAFIRRRR